MAQQATQALAEQSTVSVPQRDQKNQTWFSFIQGPVPGRVAVNLGNKALITPFGLATYGKRHTLTLLVPPEMTDLRGYLDTLDRKVKEYAWEHRATLFKTPPATPDILAACHKPLLRAGKEGFSDTISLKVGDEASFYLLPDRTKTDSSVVSKGCQCACIVSPGRVWCMASQEFGLSLRLQYCLVGAPKKEDPTALFAEVAFD